MALLPVLDTLDGVAENLHALYVESDDGKFILDLDIESGPIFPAPMRACSSVD